MAGEGPGQNFELCTANADCAGGLCRNGVCTRPCDVVDEGCPSGYACDDAAIPGGLCIPTSCLQNEGICVDDFSCAFSSAQRYVCARGVAAGLCNCSQVATDSNSPPTVGLVATLLLGMMLRRRSDVV